LNEDEAWKFTEEISDPIVRMLMQGATSSAIFAWIRDGCSRVEIQELA